MVVAHTIEQLHAAVADRRGAFVPTMGALHEGHASLIRRAAALGRPVVVSIFVNPTQFGPGEDLSRYPRTLESDLSLAQASGAEVIFAPDAKTMYPESEQIPVPPLPSVATEPGLEDAHRPGHFAGVCQVVARLFDLVQPAQVLFGEKDYQQLLVITEMARQQGDRWPGLKIVPCETVREPDGLAMSSRNRYLSADQRTRALGLWRALIEARLNAHEEPITIEAAMHRVLMEHDLSVDYAVVRDARTLQRLDESDLPRRALIAARLESVRLIDNAALQVKQ